jgi:hypothetical protein
MGTRNHIPLGVFSGFSDCLRHFLGLAKPRAYAAVAVSHNHKGAERTTPASLNSLRNRIDAHQAFFEFYSTCFNSFCQAYFPPSHLKFQAAFTCTLSERRDSSVINISAAIKYNFVIALFLRPLGNQEPNLLCRFFVAAMLPA